MKNILLTGATDGIGLETARMLISLGHSVLLHGRNHEKLNKVKESLGSISKDSDMETYLADLSIMSEVESFVSEVLKKDRSIDVIINNAGVLKAENPITKDGLDIRFAVNTIAPYIITKRLLSLLGESGRVINLSSAAQTSVDIYALSGEKKDLSDMEAYSQSKLAITMWSRSMALSLGKSGPAIISVNPGSLLGSKMVKEGFGITGKDLKIGSEIITKLAFEDKFADATGKYFDNDKGIFSVPHPDALDEEKCNQVLAAIETFLKD